MADESLIVDLAALLGEPAGRVRVVPGQGGGNNRLYIVTIGNRRLIAKHYFHDPSDARDRLEAEFEFLLYTAALGLRSTPKPIARNATIGLGIYEYVEGRKLARDEIDERMIGQAIRFFLDINRRDGRERAAVLPMASEACITVSEHMSMVDRRVARLRAMPLEFDVDLEAKEFIAELADLWETVKARILGELRRTGKNLTAPVVELCLSPSDFGFHNSILRDSGEVCFVDFEYAGWDDPAKMVADFFCHPAMGPDTAHFDRFLAETMRFSPHATELEERTRLLFPVFQTKWCCIILNDFLPDCARRRRFADPSFDALGRKRIQLQKSRQLFASIRT